MHRKSLRLKGYNYSKEGMYFITICTHQKQCLFGKIVDKSMILNDAGLIIEAAVQKLNIQFPGIVIDSYVIMPNHIHMVISIINHSMNPIRENRRHMLIPKVIGFFKMNTSKRINVLQNSSGISRWQRSYYDHIIRNENDLYQIRKYIEENPLRWHLDEMYVTI